MKRTHLQRRPPGKSRGFSWGRFAIEADNLVTYRLFRRDERNKLYQLDRTFRNRDRAHIADEMKKARRVLRDRVDEIDLSLMDQAEPV